jgi:hypothetical protein
VGRRFESYCRSQGVAASTYLNFGNRKHELLRNIEASFFVGGPTSDFCVPRWFIIALYREVFRMKIDDVKNCESFGFAIRG